LEIESRPVLQRGRPIDPVWVILNYAA
jgi:hypothetical protein